MVQYIFSLHFCILGPLARTVADAAFGLDLISGYDPLDNITARSYHKIPSEGYAVHAITGTLKGKRIGLIRSGFNLIEIVI